MLSEETVVKPTHNFITWEEELEISDALYERRLIRDKYNELYGLHKWVPTDVLTPEERVIWVAGETAAARLITAYMPFAYAQAAKIAKSYESFQRFSADDLAQEAMLGMYGVVWSFDARGASRTNGDPEHTGRRFNTYCLMYVRTRIRVFAERAAHHLSVSTTDVVNTWKVRKGIAILEQSLGRTPTDEELYEVFGVVKDQSVTDGHVKGKYALSLDAVPTDSDDDLTMIERVSDSDVENSGDHALDDMFVVDGLAEEIVNSALPDGDVCLLVESLSRVIGNSNTDALALKLGLDRGHPRLEAEFDSISPNSLTKRSNKAAMMVRHPCYRSKVIAAVNDVARELGLSLPGEVEED